MPSTQNLKVLEVVQEFCILKAYLVCVEFLPIPPILDGYHLVNDYKLLCENRESGYTVSSLKAVHHCYILFVFTVSSVFFPPAVWA